MKSGHVAIMQPYLFPYLGYFHLIEASDIFIFYDDVNYIKQGWINRNNILIKEEPCTFTLPVTHASQNVLIKDTMTCLDNRWKKKFFSKLTQAYKKAPHFTDSMEVIDSVLKNAQGESISEVAIHSIKSIYQYLGEEITCQRSSDFSPHSQGIGKAKRLIKITKELGYTSYVNAPGGQELYSKPYFKNLGVDLYFVHSLDCRYPQFGQEFIPYLSIIDVLMFNNREEVKALFKRFILE